MVHPKQYVMTMVLLVVEDDDEVEALVAIVPFMDLVVDACRQQRVRIRTYWCGSLLIPVYLSYGEVSCQKYLQQPMPSCYVHPCLTVK
jgi:hypothetical protein